MRLARLVRVFPDCVAGTGETETVVALIAKGAKVDTATKDGNTPLHFAALSTRARGSLQPSVAPHARRCSARTAREAAH